MSLLSDWALKTKVSSPQFIWQCIRNNTKLREFSYASPPSAFCGHSECNYLITPTHSALTRDIYTFTLELTSYFSGYASKIYSTDTWFEVWPGQWLSSLCLMWFPFTTAGNFRDVILTDVVLCAHVSGWDLNYHFCDVVCSLFQPQIVITISVMLRALCFSLKSSLPFLFLCFRLRS
jgi:hypothetical protein